MQRVVVVIVSYECRALLDACLASVFEHGSLAGAAPTEVWVVDNGSADGTAEMVAGRYPDVRFHAAGANLGFSAANNVALRQTHHEYALILNPDTVLHAGTLPALVELMDRSPDVGIAGCRLVKPDGTFDHASRRSFPTISGALGHFSGLGRRRRAPRVLAQYRAPEREGPGPVDAVNGAFMLIRRAALDRVGLFDEGYWLYMEDLDLCYRFKQSEWVVWYEPSVSATHLKGGSSGTSRRPRQNRAFHYGMYRFYRKFEAPGRPSALNWLVYTGIAAKLGVSLVRSAVAR